MKKHIRTFYFTLLCTLLMIISGFLLTPIQKAETSMHLLNLNASTTDEETKTIVIDAGHGGYDTGSISESGIYEKDITLDIALQTGALLEDNGYNIIYTRTSDEVTWSNDNKDDLQSRVTIGEEANADYYISIHLNASDYNDGASGFEIYTNENETMQSIAETLIYKLDRLGYSQNRGLKTTQDYPLYVIDQNSVPAILVELGFITDQVDVSYILSKDGQALMAQCIMESVMVQDDD